MPELPKMLGDFAKAMSSDNITMEALKEYFKEGTGKKAESVTPFTSATKYSGVTYEEEVHVLGAPEFVLRDDFDKYKLHLYCFGNYNYNHCVMYLVEC